MDSESRTTLHPERQVLDAVLDAWARSNRALVNLLRAMPAGALDARVTPTSPTVGQLCAHLHHERMVSVFENAPEHSGALPTDEWAAEQDVEHIVQLLTAGSAHVYAAVRGRIDAGRELDWSFAHPVQLIQFLIFHDGYHHGQIKLALKAAGASLPDDVVGAQVWDVWRAR